MKLTNKLLIVFFTVLFIAITSWAYYLYSNLEISPNPRIDKNNTRTVHIEDFNEIEIQGNMWIVEVMRSDTFKIEIEGPDNLVANYLEIEKENDKIKFGVSDKINSYHSNIYLKISMPRLTKISSDNLGRMLKYTSKNSENKEITVFAGKISVKIKNFNLDNLEVKIAGGTEVSISNCSINHLLAHGANLSKYIVKKSNIKNVDYVLNGFSSILLYDFKGKLSGDMSDYSYISFSENEKDGREYYYTEKHKKFITSLGEVLPNLKWGSSEDKVREYFIKNNGTISSEFVHYGYDGKGLVINDFKYLNKKADRILAQFQNNMLYSLMIYFPNSTPLEEILKMNYGKPVINGRTWKLFNNNKKLITQINLSSKELITISSLEIQELNQQRFASANNIIILK